MSAKKKNRLNRIAASYILLCDAVSVQGGKATYFGVFNRIFAKRFPCVHPKLHLAIELMGPPDKEAEIEIRFREDVGCKDILPPSKGKIRFSAYGSAQINMDINGLQLPKDGFYNFSIWHDGELIGERTLFVEKVMEVSS